MPSEEEGLKSNQFGNSSTVTTFADGEKGEAIRLREEEPPALEDSPAADPDRESHIGCDWATGGRGMAHRRWTEET
jgi:hypothetical protein